MFVGASVRFKNVPGVVRFVGETRFASGVWVGVELDSPSGRNNGTVENIQYFQCPENHGLFVRESALDSATSETPRDSGSGGGDEVIRLTNIINRLQTKSKSMRAEVETLTARVKELEVNQSSLGEELEIATIDKETLLEQTELLRQEIVQLKRTNDDSKMRIQELNDELEIHLREVEPRSERSLSIENSKLSQQLSGLKLSNDKLQEELKSLNSKLASFERLQVDYNKMSQELLNSKSIIEELSSNLESTKQSSSIVDNLTVKNLSLTEEKNSLKISIKELEDLKKIEVELDKESNNLIEQLNNQIELSSNEIKAKDQLIQKLRSKIRDLQESDSTQISVPIKSQEESQYISGKSAPENENQYLVDELKQSLRKMENDKLRLSLEVELLRFQVLKNGELLKELIPNVESAEKYCEISFHNYHLFFTKMIEFVELNNNDLLVDLICVRIRSQLYQLSDIMRSFVEQHISDSSLLSKTDAFTQALVKYIQEGEFNEMLNDIVRFNSEMEGVSVPENYLFPNRLGLEKFVNNEVFSLQMITELIDIFRHNEDISNSLTQLFQTVKRYEKQLEESTKEIQSAKTENNELGSSDEYTTIHLGDFLESFAKFAATGSGINEVKKQVSKVISEYDSRSKTSRIHLDWEHIEISNMSPHTNENTKKQTSISESLKNELSLKSTYMEELKIKIEVLNSKLSNYKQLSKVLDECRTKNERLLIEREELLGELEDQKSQNAEYAKIISQSSNSLILNNFEFDSLIEFKSKLEKVELISEIQSLRRSVRYYNDTKRGSKDYSWLKKELPKFKPFHIELDEVEELRKIGSDIRRQVERSVSLLR